MTGVGVESDGSAYVVGYTLGTVDGSPNSGEGGDGILRKYSTNGNVTWTKRIATDKDDRCRAVVLDAAGNPHVACFTFGDLGPGKLGLVAVKLNTSGNTLWSSVMNHGSIAGPRSIALDNNGTVYVAGETWSTKPDGDGYIWQVPVP